MGTRILKIDEEMPEINECKVGNPQISAQFCQKIGFLGVPNGTRVHELLTTIHSRKLIFACIKSSGC